MFELIILLSAPQKPLAYLDPGSGSIIIQLILAGLLGFGVFVRLQWKRIKSFFTRETDSKSETQALEDE
jgi:hypothetical protein